MQNGVNILGTTPEKIDNAEDRQKHSAMLDDLGIDQPAWSELKKMEDAAEFCRKVCMHVCICMYTTISNVNFAVLRSREISSRVLLSRAQ
jgi:carbamoyl-phosphate synthase large subunit